MLHSTFTNLFLLFYSTILHSTCVIFQSLDKVSYKNMAKELFTEAWHFNKFYNTDEAISLPLPSNACKSWELRCSMCLSTLYVGCWKAEYCTGFVQVIITAETTRGRQGTDSWWYMRSERNWLLYSYISL